jgi:hypothetical protein
VFELRYCVTPRWQQSQFCNALEQGVYLIVCVACHTALLDWDILPIFVEHLVHSC